MPSDPPWHSSASCAAASHPSAVSSMNWHACVLCCRHCFERGERADTRAGQGSRRNARGRCESLLAPRTCAHLASASRPSTTARSPLQRAPSNRSRTFLYLCAACARGPCTEKQSPQDRASHEVLHAASRLRLVNCARTLVRSAGDSGCRGERASSRETRLTSPSASRCDCSPSASVPGGRSRPSSSAPASAKHHRFRPSSSLKKSLSSATVYTTDCHVPPTHHTQIDRQLTWHYTTNCYCCRNLKHKNLELYRKPLQCRCLFCGSSLW